MAVKFSISEVFFRVYKETNKLRGHKKCGHFLQTIVSLMEGLNNLKLNGEMLASLYSHSIIDITSKKVIENKLSKTLIFFRDSSHAKLPDKQHKFLAQILNACKINILDVEIINLANKQANLENIINNTSPEYILSFGSGTGTELFAMKNNRGTRYLNAPDLSELMLETPASKQMKGKLWTELKAMFNL
jgi:hypothetical protein